ncbi:hypothetical protein N8772_03305 [Rickettsiales bacterium]|nr:hypothetical protein [Rickettsiales bacterium]
MKNITQIKKNKKNTLIIFRFCITFLILSSSVFLFYIFDSNNSVVNIIKYKNIDKKSSNKLMSNPKIRFEYENGNFYDIKGKSAKYYENGNVIVNDVIANSDSGNIISEELNITNNGNIIIFTGKPELEFYSKKR